MPLPFDIRAILRTKAPKAHVPNFVIRYLERITHVKQMNAFLRKYPDLKGYDFIRLVIDEELGCSATIEGIENIPTDGRPVIFASNHPLGGLDGMMIAQMIHESRSEQRELKVIVNELLMYMEPINSLWAPVNKVGRLSKEQAVAQQRMWESETDVLTFPAGACSRLQRIDGHWQVQDLEWQKNFIQRAREYHRDIVPIYFEGRNSRPSRLRHRTKRPSQQLLAVG